MSKEGQIHYKDKAWIVQTDPLFLDRQSLYIVSDKRIPTFEIELDSEEKPGESNPINKVQKSVRTEALSPTALKTAVTSSFFKALMTPIHWSYSDWIKAIGVGFSFYMMLKWILLAVFKVPLP